ncbi:MAG: gliding motility-associated C-terminal domain-containing protein [Crocinitomicaceae bacterium]|nr:gliding motility-associated C-terminal domain-containing protein [Flavobacteriales bacterium]NQZ38412.1 gliding motility-associated C-terminal domain-containing protein [Crocinitomicaceae bacterium]
MKRLILWFDVLRGNSFGSLLLVFVFLSNEVISQAPCNPPIPFNAGIDSTLACGDSIQLGETPIPVTPDYTLASTCLHTARFQPNSLTQGGGIYVDDVTTSGGSVNINNMNTLVDVGNVNPMGPNAWSTIWLSDFSASHYVEACSGSTFYLNIGAISLYNNTPYFCRVWVDWNNDGAFAAGEVVYTSPAINTHPNITISNVAIIIPTGQTYGAYRMRIRFKDNAPFVASDGACTYINAQGIEAPYAGYSGSQTGSYTFSDEIEDYSVHVNCGNSFGGGFTYSWSPPTGLNSTTISNPIATPSQTTTYTVTVTDTVDNCYTTGQVTVTVPSITPSFVNPGPICVGENFILPTTSIEGITGVWSPSIDNTQTTAYTFTADTNQCAISAQMTVVVNPLQAPLFTNPGPICSGSPLALPVISDNGISGTWSPAMNNTATTTYTFTPDNLTCSTITMLTVIVENQVIPTFTNPGPICVGSLFTLLSVSDNGITGAWSPAVNNSVTTTYTFTPDNVMCATTIDITVVVQNQVIPTFTNPGPICAGSSFTLPGISNNGLTGTWTPAINNTATTTYTFAPDNLTCATAMTLTVVVENQITPTFTNLGPICSGASLALSTISDNGITGTWSPAINNTVTTTYTFVPDNLLCALDTQLSIIVVPVEVPLFTNPGPICSGDSFTLPLISDNGIDGTWSPAVNNASTTTYTFIPASNSACAIDTQLTVIVNPLEAPIFNNPGPLCAGTNFTLSLISNNGIPGSWSPAINNMTTTTYTFMPDDTVCTSSITMEVEVNPGFEVLVSDEIDVCPGETIAPINVTAIGGTAPFTFTYSFNNGNSIDITSNQSIVNIDPMSYPGFNSGNANCYTITIGGIDAGGCVMDDTTFIDHLCIHQAPEASFSLIDESGGVYSTLNTSTGATGYEWNFSDNSASEYSENVIHQFSTETTANYSVELVAFSDEGCTDTAYQIINIEEELIFYVPNSFTPDGDEYNNTFKPVMTSGFDTQNYQLEIYNRWGELIFVSQNAEVGWDGTYNGNMAQDGTYVWKIRLKLNFNDDKKEYVGHVNIIR